MTPAQIKFTRGLLARQGIADQKDELVHQFTDGRTTHLSEMTYQETQVLITALGVKENPRDRQVRKILSLAHDMKWETPDGKVDMQRVNAWCVKYTEAHKPLDELSEDELPAVVTIFSKVHATFLKGI